MFSPVFACPQGEGICLQRSLHPERELCIGGGLHPERGFCIGGGSVSGRVCIGGVGQTPTQELEKQVVRILLECQQKSEQTFTYPTGMLSCSIMKCKRITIVRRLAINHKP